MLLKKKKASHLSQIHSLNNNQYIISQYPPEVVVVFSRQFLKEYSELLQLLGQVFLPAIKEIVLKKPVWNHI